MGASRCCWVGFVALSLALLLQRWLPSSDQPLPLEARNADCWDIVREAISRLPPEPLEPVGIVKSGTYDWRQVLQDFREGKLNGTMERYRLLLGARPMGVRPQWPRESGAPQPWGHTYVPVASSDGKRKLILTGDSITMAAPMCPSAPYALAVATNNPSFFVENIAWGAMLAVQLLSPGDFGIPLPRPGDVKADFVVVQIGGNDNMFRCAPETVAHENYATGPTGSYARMPKDWRERCNPSLELFEASLTAIARLYRATGARVALMSVGILGEDISGAKDPALHRSPPFRAAVELGEVAQRVAEKEGCAFLPLTEFMHHHIAGLQRPRLTWDFRSFKRLMDAHFAAQLIGPVRRWSELAPQDALQHDLGHLAEEGAAMVATLVQAWLDAELGWEERANGAAAAAAS